MPKTCKECHHTPSCRFNANGWQCYCKCHDVADTAPDLLAACEYALIALTEASTIESDQRGAVALLRAAIAKEGA